MSPYIPPSDVACITVCNRQTPKGPPEQPLIKWVNHSSSSSSSSSSNSSSIEVR